MKLFSLEIEKEICEKYIGGDKIKPLSLFYKCSDTTIRTTLTKNGIKIRKDNEISNRKYFFDTNIFDQINTEEKAYWLGFIYADGCNYEKRYSLILGLSSKDSEHLKKFRDFLKINKELKFFKSKKGSYKNSEFCELVATDIHFSKRLAELGVVSRKTHILKFPTQDQVPEHLIHHFIRGYFDGDGCITYTKPKRSIRPQFSISIVGTIDFLSEMILRLKFIKKGLFLQKRHKERDNTIRSFSIGGNNRCMEFYNLIYSNATVCLSRKRERFKILEDLNKVFEKKVRCLGKDGALIKVYNNSKDAAEDVGANYRTIESFCSGNAYKYHKKTGEKLGLKKFLKGYRWEYEDIKIKIEEVCKTLKHYE